MTHRLAVDIGGTFVDAVLFNMNDGSWRIEKSFTTPRNAAAGVIQAIKQFNVEGKEVSSFIHGTTLGLNTVLERKGAVTGLITNAGFEDILEMGRYSRDRTQMYSLEYHTQAPLVPKRMRIGVPCRLDAKGQVLESLDESAVKAAAKRLVDEYNVNSIAVCFLHAYVNPEHERRAAEIIQHEWPDLSVSISSDIVREYREYERTSTTAVNAYIQPIFRRYIRSLEGALTERGFQGSFYITRSGGGALRAEGALDAPVHTIFSGPAGGLIGTATLNEILGGGRDLIAVDIGGTSTDACVVRGGTPSVVHQSSLERLPLMIPTYDIATIGAGGGSIARVEDGLMKVGPQSSGAEPGPICYGRGGKIPTFTDAAVVLGYIDPDVFLGSEVRLNVDAAFAGIEKQIAKPLDLSVLQAACGIFDVVLARTVSAIREITVEQGLDPREFSMLAYGGAGPVFVPLVGREIGVKEIIVPQAPSVFSAWGMLMTDFVQEYSRTTVGLLGELGLDYLREIAGEMALQAKVELRAGGFNEGDQRIETDVALRYFGQEFSLNVEFAEGDTVEALSQRFDAAHRDRYGHTLSDPIQVVHVRVRGVGLNSRPQLQKIPVRKKDEPLLHSSRSAYCFARRNSVDFAVYKRRDFRADDIIAGPAIVEEETTTLVFYSDQEAQVDQFGHLMIRNKIEV